MARSTALVVAHPDDEALWFSSILAAVDAVVLCFEEVPSRPDWSAGRRRAVAAYPLPGVESLRLIESEAFDAADWWQPVPTEYGLAIERRPQALPGMNARRYFDNYHALRRDLGGRLRGCDRVYTHNPWGEYGHEEHVQVYRAVKSLQAELGYEIWFDNYVSNKSSRLLLQYIGGFTAEYETRETDPALGQRLASLYKEYGCWTWFDDYRWFTHECFMTDHALPRAAEVGHLFPVNFLKVGEPASEPSAVRKAAGAVRAAIAGIGRTVRGYPPFSLLEKSRG